MKLAKKKHKHIKVKNPPFWRILNETQERAALRRAHEEFMRLHRLITENGRLAAHLNSQTEEITFHYY